MRSSLASASGKTSSAREIALGMSNTDLATAAITAAECREIEQHKWFMSQQAGHDVGYEVARQDWLERHGLQWRQQRQETMLAMQREEINRHKWIESEKARRDLGRDACMDWIRNYAAQWRDWYERQYGTPQA